VQCSLRTLLLPHHSIFDTGYVSRILELISSIMSMRFITITIVGSILAAISSSAVNEIGAAAFAFSPQPRFQHRVASIQHQQFQQRHSHHDPRRTATPSSHRQQQLQLNSSADPDTIESTTNLEQEISSMRVSAIKQELESYGISTKTFLEKSELVIALVKARKEGKTPMVNGATTSTSNDASSSTSQASTSTPPPASYSAEERKERIQSEMSNLQSLKVSELKSELENVYGISTKSYFEKSEFVRVLAEARVDGVKKSTSSKSKTKKRRSSSSDDDDDDDAEVVKAKVEVITSDNVGPRTKKSREDASSGSAGAGNPFGGGSPFGGGMPGGMGGMDMGNIADMLKGMGGMGGGSNPFGGGMGGGAAGASNPFGGMGGAGMADAMKAAQQAMSNPKVRAVIDKAQKNPKVMAAVQECMGNPMAMAKYMSDPEVGPILKELQDAMM